MPQTIFIMNSIGLMSGTSMDGIDAALITTDGEHEVKSYAHIHLAYTPEAQLLFKALEYSVQKAHGDLKLATQHFSVTLPQYLHKQLGLSSDEINRPHLAEYLQTALNDNKQALTLDRIIQYSTQLHADAVQALQRTYSISSIDCVGYHGQTVFHRPLNKKTVQIGLGPTLAAMTKLTVVYDFRSNDVALGGQGAPFAPIYHQAIAIRDQLLPVGIINCGGIANATLILGKTLDDIIGFDAGPGNCLLDMYIRQLTQGREQMDRDGGYALAGVVHSTTLTHLLQTQYKPSLRALDSHDFSLPSELEHLSPEDACRTLVQFTVECMIQSLKKQKTLPKRYILCGGGAYHPGIRQVLTERLKEEIDSDARLHTAEEVGWKNQAIEAELMAYLAVRSLKNLPLSLPKTTGVPSPALGGKIALPDDIIKKFQE